ncbi:DASH complex subunit dam1 [Malassezia yamatoensis]|uniref:DASH complex subunit DAM1 n=1 Tax=Malassezia yamatoensis TaxID=253288 RepID=A0AAJ5YX26_9BASI|nr:DASH complex subunit dam1 [Malassezia yamatoensis]
MSASRPTSTPIRRISSGSLATSSRLQNQASTPLSFLQREALPMLDEETSTLQQNLAQIHEIHTALHTFDESFATFLYGIKMNAFCVEWPEAPSEQDLARPRPSTKMPTIASNPMTRIDASADDSYRTDSDSSLPGPGSIRDLRATPKAQTTSHGQRRVVNRREIPKRQQPQPKPATNQWKRQEAMRNQAPKHTQSQTELSGSDCKQAGKSRTQLTRRAEPQPVPKKIPLAIKRRREAFAEQIIDTMPLEYRNGDANQRRLLQHILLALISSQEQGVRVAELAKPPELPAGKVNKALIALHATNHVVRTSQNVRDASNMFRDCCIG